MHKPIDIHTHLLNYQVTPEKVYFGGREWNLKKLSPILHAYCESDPIDDVVEWIYNLFTKKDIDSDPWAKVFFTPLEEQHKLFAEMPCTPNVMTIDFGGEYDQLFKAVVNADDIAIRVDGYLCGGMDMTRGIHPLGARSLKAYTALWTNEQYTPL